ncbi:MAG: sulfite exporter TauE/SafE family protein [Burkholderiaceae bacterium]
MTDVTLLSVFLVGLLGGLHCAGMCGGIVAVMGAGASRPAGRTIPIRPAHAAPAWPVLLGYNAGRIASYVAAGTLAGALGSSAALVRTVLPVQQVAFVAANLVLIAMGLYLTGVLRSVAVLEVAGRGLWRALQPLAARALAARDFPRALAAGLVWGWVPCGMVYGVLVAALVSGSALQGAELALAFGLGTLPNLLALGWSAAAARRWLGHRALRVAAGVLVVAFGVAGLARIDPLAHLHQVVDACLSLF